MVAVPPVVLRLPIRPRRKKPFIIHLNRLLNHGPLGKPPNHVTTFSSTPGPVHIVVLRFVKHLRVPGLCQLKSIDVLKGLDLASVFVLSLASPTLLILLADFSHHGCISQSQ